MSLFRVMAAFVLVSMLAGCLSTRQSAELGAARQIGAAAAGVTVERQPDDCGKTFPDLEGREGEEPTSLLRRYVLYVRGPINERVRACYLFNQTQLDRLSEAGR